jgi:hypothetical protein
MGLRSYAGSYLLCLHGRAPGNPTMAGNKIIFQIDMEVSNFALIIFLGPTFQSSILTGIHGQP